MDVRYCPSFSDLLSTVKSFFQRLPVFINIKTTKSCRATLQHKLSAIIGSIEANLTGISKFINHSHFA